MRAFKLILHIERVRCISGRILWWIRERFPLHVYRNVRCWCDVTSVHMNPDRFALSSLMIGCLGRWCWSPTYSPGLPRNAQSKLCWADNHLQRSPQIQLLSFCWVSVLLILSWRPRPNEITPPVWLFVSLCTAYEASIQVNSSVRVSAASMSSSSIVDYRKCRRRRNFVQPCSVHFDNLDFRW